MPDNEQSISQADEVVFAARYSSAKIWFSIIVIYTFPFVLMFGGACIGLAQKKYFGAFGLLILASAILLFSAEALFSKELLFYQDRVVKVWDFFGRKTIYYSTASVHIPERYMRWLYGSYTIFERRDEGKPVRMRLPIVYYASFFPPNTAKQIETIMDYMTENKEDNPRKFKKFTLPKEVTCPRSCYRD